MVLNGCNSFVFLKVQFRQSALRHGFEGLTLFVFG